MSAIEVIFYPTPVTHDAYRVDGVVAGTRVGELTGGRALVLINGAKVADDAVIVDGDHVLIRARPRLEVGFWLANMLVGALGLTGTTAIVAGYVITIGTALALTAGLSYAAAKLVAPQIPGPGEPFNRRASLTRTSNQPNHFGPVPDLYGTRRYFPPFAANPYTEISGNDQYLYLLLCLGYGPIQINGIRCGAGFLRTQAHNFGDKIRIGDTPITTYDEVEFQIGVIDDISLFSRDVDEEALSVTMNLVYNVAGDPAGSGWRTDNVSATRTSAVGANVLSVDIVFPGGLFTAGKDNTTNVTPGVDAALVQFRVEYRQVGTGPWLVAIDPWDVYGTKRETLRVSHRWPVVKGQYEVRVTRLRTFLADQEIVVTDAVWTALRTIRYSNPWTVDYANDGQEIVLLAMRVKATDQLQGTLQNVSVQATRMLQVFNGSSWTSSYVATESPAWAYANMLRGKQLKRPVANSRIKGAELLAWSQWCASKGIGYSWVHDQSEPLVDRLRAVASCGRAAWSILDGKFGVVQDIAQTDPVQMFSPRNSSSYSGEFAFPDPIHGLRVRYDDPTSWETVERVVYADGYNASNATRLEILETQGVISAEQAWKEGRYHLAQRELRPELHRINVDFEALAATRGDFVLLSNDAIAVGQKWGRVSRVLEDGLVLALDEQVTMQTGTQWGLRIRRQDNTYVIREVVAADGQFNNVTLTQAVTGVNQGDLFTFGELSRDAIECKVLEVSYGHDLSAQVTLIPHAPEIDDADTGTIPDFDPGITKPIDVAKIRPSLPIVDMIQSGTAQLLRAPDGSIRASVNVAFTLASSGVICDYVQARWRVADSGNAHHVVQEDAGSDSVVLIGMDDGALLDIQLRARSTYGVWSDWTTVVQHTVVGKLEPPPDVTDFLVRRLQDGTRYFTWEVANAPIDIAGFVIRYSLNLSATWDDMTPLHDGLLIASPYETNQLAAGEYVVGIKMVDVAGVESVNARTITSTLGDPRLGNVIKRVEIPDFPDTKTDCWYDARNSVLVPRNQDTWADLPATWAEWGMWNSNPVTSMQYTTDAIDLTAVLPFTPVAEAIMYGGSWAAEESHSDDGVTYSSWAAIGAPVVARYVMIRFTFTNPTPAGVYFAAVNLTGNVIEDELSDIDTSTLTTTTGVFRAPLTKTFGIITSVQMALQNVGPGWTWEVIDKDVNLGPRLKIYDNTGTLANATVDILVRGL